MVPPEGSNNATDENTGAFEHGWSPAFANQLAKSWPHSARWVTETGSTNADLLACAPSATNAMVLVSDYQSSGRGRLDRKWDAAKAQGLLMSFLVPVTTQDAWRYAMSLGVAAIQACARVVSVDAALKWPNDVMVDDKKVAGILAQSTTMLSGHGLVIGMGMNVTDAAIKTLPPEVAERATSLEAHTQNRPTTGSIRVLVDDLSDPMSSPRFLLAVAVAETFAALLDAEPSDVLERYRECLATLGRSVKVSLTSGEVLLGTAVGVRDDGALLIDERGVRHEVHVGDVTHMRSASTRA